MAEEFNLDDNLQENLVEALNEDDNKHPSLAKAQENALKQRRRWLPIGLAVGLVFFVGVILFSFQLTRNKPSTSKPSSVNSLNVDQKNIETKKKPKKKKKIKYIVLFSNLEGEQVARILKTLSFENIAFTTQQSGKKFTILVDKTQQEEARKLLAIKGLPAGTAKGYELLDNAQTLGVTEFDKRIRFLRALSGELEKAISSFDMIEDAKVQIVLPEQRLFAVTQPPVTAAILIRRILGANIDDGVVFSIIQLVANAVENLQPENVSVIDTQGQVLSEGIFERIASQKASSPEEEKESSFASSQANAIPMPIIPNYEQMKEWLVIKKKYEKSLVEKAMKQLMGVLPLGTYKVTITSDLGPLENGDVVDVRRLTASIVVDNLNDDIYLDDQTKRQIFNTIAGAIGYVKGRDSIQLSRADFTLLTAQEKAELERFKRQRKPGIGTWFLRIIGLLALLSLAYYGYQRLRGWRNQNNNIEELLPSSEQRENQLDSLQEEIELDKQIEQVRRYADTNPDILTSLIREWIKPELSQNQSEEEQANNELTLPDDLITEEVSN